MKVAALVILVISCGCATKQPGGRSDFWTTHSHVENNVIYNGIGFRF